MEQQQEPVTQEVQLAQRLQVVEDRLILASLPILILCLILWAIAAAYPALATFINLMVTILVVLVSCVVTIRLVETAWRWGTDVSDEGPGAVGSALITLLLLVGAGALVDTVMHAGIASVSRSFIIVVSLLILALQYRTIILRWMKK